MTNLLALKKCTLRPVQNLSWILRCIFGAVLLILMVNISVANQHALTTGFQSVNTSSDDKAELRNILQKINNFTAEFEQVITDGNGELIQQASGNIVVAKPQRLRWEIIEPEPSLLIADSQTIFNVDPFVEQVTLIDQSDMTSSNPLMLLISDEQSQWKSVSVSKQDSSFIIVPTEADASITQLILEFDSDHKLKRLSSLDRQEQKSTINFTNLVTNKPIASDVFVFQVPANYVVDDQRAN